LLVIQEFDFTITFGSQLVRIDEGASKGYRPSMQQQRIGRVAASIPKNPRGQNGSGIDSGLASITENMPIACEHNRDRCYVPEWMLKRWGMPVDPNVA
jgi:hypothetical protein